MNTRRCLWLAVLLFAGLIVIVSTERRNVVLPREANAAASATPPLTPVSIAATPSAATPTNIPSSGGVWHLPLPISAQLPETFNDWERVTCGNFSSGARPLGANASRRETIADGKSLYRDAFPGCDVTFDPQQYKVEEFITLRETSAQHEWAWELDLQHGALKPRLTPMHSVELVDAQGTPRVRIDPPSGKDANGKVLNAGEELVFTLDGNRLTLKADVKDCAMPVVIDPSFSTTGTMTQARQNHSATTLNDGRVLVVGGFDGGSGFKTCEIYDAATRTFSATGSMTQGRGRHGAVLLNDGTVLVTGGSTAFSGSTTNTCERFNPSTGMWSPAGAPSSDASIPYINSATGTARLIDGRVIAIVSNHAEIYDPTTDLWSIAANPIDYPNGAGPLCTLLDGRVLLLSGASQIETQIYTPGTDTWAVSSDLLYTASAPTLCRLSDGRALVLHTNELNRSPELFAPGSETWSSAPFPVPTAPNFSSAQLAAVLSDGRVFGPGTGITIGPIVSSCVLFDPVSSTWSPTSPLPRNITFTTDATCTALPGSLALVAGGTDNTNSRATNIAALFDTTAPDVSLAASPATVVQGQTVFFTTTGSDPLGGTVSYQYDFGDGTSGTGPDATHTYSAIGTYTVKVTVTASGGKTNSATKVITVLAAGSQPTARFVTSDVVGFVGFPLAFDAIYSTDPQNAIVSYSWDFGDGSPAGSGQSISHSYTTAGTYNVTLTIKDGDGLTSTVTHPLVVLGADQQGLFNGGISYKVKWDRTKTATDSLTQTATVNVGDATVGAGTAIALEIAGQRFTGTLDGKLRDKETNLNWQVKANLRKQAFGEADIKVTIKKADLGAGFNAAGIVAGTDLSEKVEANVPIHLELAGKTFEIPVPSEFKFGNEGKRASGSGDGP